ncbi:helix-turn-helix domain-containing protein [Marinobacterium litorale]|uniref:AraC-like ligand-binding domain-containing protein n=1 Tax=Marinobacterium litorale TaxID=404770 RepID=UPI000416C5EE|nr:helix-turn-helix domain-containing protein [Marinobacterium litorale]
MHSSYSTHTLPQAERQAYWQDVIGRTYFPLDLEMAQPERLHGNLKQWQLGQIGISRLESSPTRFRRHHHHIDDSEEPCYLITVPDQSSVSFSQANHSVVCQSGAFILERSDLPYDFSYNSHNALWVLRIPLSQLCTRIRAPERYLYMEFDRQKGIGAVFFTLLQSLVLQSSHAAPSSHPYLSQQLIDILALSLENDDRVLMSQESGLRSAHLHNIEHYVRANLKRSDLKPDQIAQACQISTRYLHKLFKDSNQTVSQWIRELRLQSALNDIRAEPSHVTLAEIAYRWGFNDQAHFCRQFKSRFGCTPREAREQR